MIDPPAHLIFVCTANICRSPVAELMLRHRLGDLDGSQVSSAGVRAHPDLPIDDRMRQLLAADGITSDDFRATEVDREILERASVIVTMTRKHRSTLVTRHPELLGQTFTLLELSALLSETGPADSLTELASRRPYLSITADELDVVDPYKRRKRIYTRTYTQIRRCVDTIARVLYHREEPSP